MPMNNAHFTEKVLRLPSVQHYLAKSTALPNSNFTVSGASWINCG